MVPLVLPLELKPVSPSEGVVVQVAPDVSFTSSKQAVALQAVAAVSVHLPDAG